MEDWIPTLQALIAVGLALLLVMLRLESERFNAAEYDEVILGCIDQLGPQAMDVARNAWLAAGLSEDVPGTTVERQCGSGQQSFALAHSLIASGTVDVAIACGVENMSRVPMGSNMGSGVSKRSNSSMACRNTGRLSGAWAACTSASQCSR